MTDTSSAAQPTSGYPGATEDAHALLAGVGSTSVVGQAVRGKEKDIVGLTLTGYLDSEIRSRTADSDPGQTFRWSVAPGIDRRGPLRTVAPALRQAIAQLPGTSECLVSIGWMDGDRRHHLVPGRTTLANALTRASTARDRRRLIASSGGLGSVLRQFRDIPLETGTSVSRPAGPARLAHWLRTGDGPFAASVMHDSVCARLGQSRIEEILAWIDEMPREQVLHGRAGLAATVAAETDVPSVLLTGDEVAVGPRDFDLSCVLGELLIAEQATEDVHPGDAARQRALISDCRDAVLIGYGPSKDLISAGRMTAMRVLLELHDSAAYLDRQLTALAARAPELVDDSR